MKEYLNFLHVKNKIILSPKIQIVIFFHHIVPYLKFFFNLQLTCINQPPSILVHRKLFKKIFWKEFFFLHNFKLYP